KEEGKEIEIENDQAVDGIVQDIVMRTAIQKDLDDRKSLEAKRIENRLEKIKMVLNDFPTKRFGIGTMVKFEKEHWSKNNLLSKKNFRVFHIQLSAHAQDQELSAHYDAHFAAYDMNMVIEMELEDTPEIHLPRFKLPNYPLQVEGKIVSESGADDEKTYQFYTNEESSQEDYTVLVPFWDLEIKAPYVPGVFTGHFYFPAFKDARVLLDLYLDRAVIKGFLDWGEGSRLPMDTQGNHLLFGKTAQSQTSMKYLYTEDKPVFTIKRTSDTDTEMIQMEEESIIIQTKDEED
ncbi:MAG: hypothetical protein KKE61_22965, partial [Proteobacteria bacterium]|nr:hypothetical protein [Pseudomonadota bacterium]